MDVENLSSSSSSSFKRPSSIRPPVSFFLPAAWSTSAADVQARGSFSHCEEEGEDEECAAVGETF